MNFKKRTWSEIDITALKKNIKTIKSSSGQKEIIAVVKANAYGHGVNIIAPALWDENIRYFAVSNMNEAIELNSILPYSGLKIIIFGYVDAALIGDNDFIYTVGSLDYGEKINREAIELGIKIRVHIKLDTGMTRVGIDSKEELTALLALPGLSVEAVYTHFAVSDSESEENIAYTNMQQHKLLDAVKNIKIPFHSQNSGGILYHKDFEGGFIRVGIAMYGYHPNPDIGGGVKLYPVMTLKSVVWQVKDIVKDSFISYGRTYKSSDNMRVAVIPIGYADGYSRALSNRGSVQIRGGRAPVLGRVCMDQIVVDVSGINGVAPGDEVLIYSPDTDYTNVDYIAGILDTISYEVLCNISARVQRIKIND